MAKTSNQKQLVRMLAMEIGLRPAARKLGLNEDTVCSWADRDGWNITGKAQNGRPSVASTLQASPADVLQDELNTNERETRLSLSRYVKNASKTAEQAPLESAPLVHKVGQTAGIAFKWDQKSDTAGNVIVNVALLGVQPADVAPTTIDVESGVSE